jgi:hypothetical protein
MSPHLRPVKFFYTVKKEPFALTHTWGRKQIQTPNGFSFERGAHKITLPQKGIIFGWRIQMRKLDCALIRKFSTAEPL